VAKGAIRNEPFDRLTAHVSYSGRNVGLAAGQLSSGAKQVQLSATFDHAPDRFDAGRLRFRVSSNAMPLEQIHTLQEARPGLTGTVQVAADGDVELGQPRFRISGLNADVWLRGLQWTGEPLRDVHLTANSEGPVLRAHLDSGVADSTGPGRWRVAPGRRLSRQRHHRLFQSGTRPNARLDVAFGRQCRLAVRGFGGGPASHRRPALTPQLMKAELRISKFEIGPAPDAGLPTRHGDPPQRRPPGGHHGQLRHYGGERPPGGSLVRDRHHRQAAVRPEKVRWIFA